MPALHLTTSPAPSKDLLGESVLVIALHLHESPSPPRVHLGESVAKYLLFISPTCHPSEN